MIYIHPDKIILNTENINPVFIESTLHLKQKLFMVSTKGLR